jgi:aromatic-L-amino-acid/L-tryptophan decarboxylase
MLGLPEGFCGVIQDTASTATLSALLTAREVATGFSSNEKGIGNKLRVYASREAHSSIEKGVKIAGYGRENLCYIPTDENYAMRPDRLEVAVKEDLEAGFKPACVIATIGTTSSTAIDPLPEIGLVCRKYDIWLHVDAAFAGTASILEEKRDLLKGSEHIDSFVFNPHKWLFTNFDCSAYFVRNPGHLIRTMSINPEYLKTSRDSQVNNYRDWGIQLGRRFRALKLWFVIREYGVEGLQKMVRKHIGMANEFADRVRSSEDFEVMAPVSTSVVCFRWNDGKNQ